MEATAYGPTVKPDKAFDMCNKSFSCKENPLPCKDFSLGATDLIFDGDPACVCSVRNKGRPLGGRLRLFAEEYSKEDPWLADQLSQGYSFVRKDCDIAPVFFQNHPTCHSNKAWLDEEIAALLASGFCALYDESVCRELGAPRVVCALHVEESSNKLRIIWDARPVINIDKPGKVKYESIEDILHLLERGQLCFKTDCASGYFQVPMKRQDAPVLCFSWRGLIFFWCVLPFGLRSAPSFFERCTKPLRARLRSTFPNVFLGYLDDFFAALREKQQARAKEESKRILKTMTALGWVLGGNKTTDPAT